MKNEIYEKLNEIFRDLFNKGDIVVSESTTAADIEEWDSLMQIYLIGAVQDTFGISFSMKQMTSFHNVGEMVEAIAQQGER